MYPMTSDSLSFAFTGSQLKDTLLPSWSQWRLAGGWAGAMDITQHPKSKFKKTLKESFSQLGQLLHFLQASKLNK